MLPRKHLKSARNNLEGLKRLPLGDDRLLTGDLDAMPKTRTGNIHYRTARLPCDTPSHAVHAIYQHIRVENPPSILVQDFKMPVPITPGQYARVGPSPAVLSIFRGEHQRVKNALNAYIYVLPTVPAAFRFEERTH
jgi:hypothetical protein